MNHLKLFNEAIIGRKSNLHDASADSDLQEPTEFFEIIEDCFQELVDKNQCEIDVGFGISHSLRMDLFTSGKKYEYYGLRFKNNIKVDESNIDSYVDILKEKLEIVINVKKSISIMLRFDSKIQISDMYNIGVGENIFEITIYKEI